MYQNRNNNAAKKQYFCLLSKKEVVYAFFMVGKQVCHTKHASVKDAMIWMQKGETKSGKDHVMVSFAPTGSAQYNRIISEVRELRKEEGHGRDIVRFPSARDISKFRFFDLFKKAISQWLADQQEIKVTEVKAEEQVDVLAAKPKAKRTKKA